MSDIDDCRKSVERLTRDRGEVMRAGNDKIAEIRERHTMYPPTINSRHSFIVAYQDIATLLAEVDRQRAEIERLRVAATSAGAALAAAIELLERGREDAPSKRMFSQMLADYRVIVARTRKALEGKP